MKRLSFLLALFAFLPTGCSDDNGSGDPSPEEPENHLQIEGSQFHLTGGQEIWRGSFYSPGDEVDVCLSDSLGRTLRISFCADNNQVNPGSYTILPHVNDTPLDPKDCHATHSFLTAERKLISGSVEVLISTNDYPITLSGIDDRNHQIYLSYIGPLEYRAEGHTGNSTLRLDGGTLNDLGLLTLHSYGRTATREIHATVARIAARPTEDLDAIISGELTFFHAADTLSPGVYTFPATSAGTFRGYFEDSPDSYRISDGNIEVGISDGQYTLRFNAITLLDEQTGQSHVLVGGYTGPACVEDLSGATDKPAP